MWNLPGATDRHCSDETLLALADGELSRFRQWCADRHLKRCWQCRARLFEAEEETRKVALAIARSEYPGAGRVAGARQRIVERMTRKPGETRKVPSFRPHSASHRWPVWATAMAALVLAAGTGWQALRWDEPPSAEEILAGVQEHQARLAGGPFEQRIGVELAAPSTAADPVRGELRIWSDGQGRAFASRFTDSNESLRHAVWRDGADRLYVYNASQGGAAARVVERAAPAGVVTAADVRPVALSAGAVERAFLRWIESRNWRTVSLAPEMLRLVSSGFVLEVSRVSLPGSGNKVLRVAATRRSSGRTVQLFVEADPVTFRPLQEWARFQADGEFAEFRLIPADAVVLTPARATEVFSRDWVQRTVFGPALRIPGGAVATARRHRPVDSALPHRLSPLSAAELLEMKLRIYYALHRTGACLGEPIRVSAQADGRIEIDGVVETVARRLQLAAALTDAAPAERIRVRLRAAEEALAEAEASDAGERRGRDSAVTGLPRVVVEGSPPPLTMALQRRHGARGMPIHQAAEEAAQTGDRCVELAESLLAEAWALRHIGEAFGAEEMRELPADARWLLEVMVGDHVRETRLATGQMERLLDIPLLELAGEHPRPDAERATARGDWSQRSRSVLADVQALHQRILAGFAGAEPNSATDAAELASLVLAELAGTRRELDGLAGQLSRDFSGDPRRLTSAGEPDSMDWRR